MQIAGIFAIEPERLLGEQSLAGTGAQQALASNGPTTALVATSRTGPSHWNGPLKCTLSPVVKIPVTTHATTSVTMTTSTRWYRRDS